MDPGVELDRGQGRLLRPSRGHPQEQACKGRALNAKKTRPTRSMLLIHALIPNPEIKTAGTNPAFCRADSDRLPFYNKKPAPGKPGRRRSGGLDLLGRVEELLVFGRAVQGCGRRPASLYHLGHIVEIAGADLALVLDRGEAFLCGREFLLLQLDEGGHVVARIAVGKLEHGVVERMKTRQGDELELVAHGAELTLE